MVYWTTTERFEEKEPTSIITMNKSYPSEIHYSKNYPSNKQPLLRTPTHIKPFQYRDHKSNKSTSNAKSRNTQSQQSCNSLTDNTKKTLLAWIRVSKISLEKWKVYILKWPTLWRKKSKSKFPSQVSSLKFIRLSLH